MIKLFVVLATTWPLVVKPSSDVAALVLVSADQPRPKFVLAELAFVAPVPPFDKARTPVMFEAFTVPMLETAMVPTKLLAGILVREDPLLAARAVKAEDAGCGLVAAAARPKAVRALLALVAVHSVLRLVRKPRLARVVAALVVLLKLTGTANSIELSKYPRLPINVSVFVL